MAVPDQVAFLEGDWRMCSLASVGLPRFSGPPSFPLSVLFATILSSFAFCRELEAVVQVSDLARVKALLKGNSNLPFMKDGGRTPRYWAVYFDRKEVAELVLADWVDPDFEAGPNDTTVLHIAAPRTRRRKELLIASGRGRRA